MQNDKSKFKSNKENERNGMNAVVGEMSCGDKSTKKEKRRTSGLAIWAVILGVLGVVANIPYLSCCGGQLATVGLILGIAALLKIRKKREALRGAPLAILGIALFMVCVLMITLRFALFNRSIHAAAVRGEVSRVKLMLEDDPEIVNRKDEFGKTALHVAARRGYKELVELLIANGANINETNDFHESPLHVATEKGHSEVIEVLLAAGADTSIKNSKGETALDLAARKGFGDIVEQLRKHQVPQ